MTARRPREERSLTKGTTRTCSFHEAVSRAPVLIRLEEGHRGQEVSMSFSAGDKIALEGDTVIRGQRVVMAHYMAGPEESEDAGTDEVYRALLTIPYDRLPSLEVSVLTDQRGHAYSNFVSRNFPSCNWSQQQDELLRKMDGDEDYTNVTVVTPTRRHHHGQQGKESWTLPTIAPPRPPRPRAPLPSGSSAGDDDTSEVPDAGVPPPRPPKPGSRSGSGSHDDTSPPLPGEKPGHLDTHVRLPDRPPAPPRPARRSDSTPVSPPVRQGSGENPDDSEVFSPGLGAMLSFAEMFQVGQGFCVDDSEEETAKSEVRLPEVVSRSKEAKKTGTALQKVKSFGKKVYNTMTIVSTAKRPTPSQTSDDSQANRPTTTSTSATTTCDKEDSDSDDAYDEVDESMMDDTFDQRTTEKKDVKAVKPEQKVGKPAKKGPKGKLVAVSAVVKPTVHVQPRGAGGDLLKPPSCIQVVHVPPKTKAPQVSVSPAKSVLPHAHRMMAPQSKDDSDEDSYEVPMDNTPLNKLNCSQLCARLQQCGMESLAKVCEERKLNGAFLCSLTDEELKKPPFSQDDFNVETKLKMIKAGWVAT